MGQSRWFMAEAVNGRRLPEAWVYGGPAVGSPQDKTNHQAEVTTPIILEYIKV